MLAPLSLMYSWVAVSSVGSPLPVIVVSLLSPVSASYLTLYGSR